MAEDTEIQRELAGYVFADEEERNQAAKELEAIHYIQQNIDPDQPGMVLEIYRQILDQRLLHTPVGTVFLQELYDFLTEVPLLYGIEIPAPPESAADADAMPEPAADAAVPPETAMLVIDTDTAVPPDALPEADTDAAVTFDLPEIDARGERRTQLSRERELKTLRAQAERWKTRCRRMQAVIVVLVIIVAAMFAISLTSGSTTILNYENKIINKYEAWEQELQQREDAVKERENALR